MKKKIMMLCAVLLACLLVLMACGKPGQQGNQPDDPDKQQGSSGTGTGTDQPGGSGSDSGDQPGGSGTDQPGGSGGSGTEQPGGDSAEPERILLGAMEGIEYWMAVYPADPARNHAFSRELYAVRNNVAEEIYVTDGVLEYAVGSLEKSGCSALYFVASETADGPATLYCYDLYGEETRQVLAAPCSNMVVFEGLGNMDGYGWVLQEDYVMPVDLKTQTADMTMAASIMELSAFADVGGSFFANGQKASIKESEYGVLEITLTRGSTMTGYLYTCDTFTAVKLK